MKQIIGIIFSVVLFNSFVLGQTETAGRKYIDQASGKILYVYQYTDIKGSSFLNDDWMESKIILNNGVTVINLRLKFDVYNNKFVYSRNDSLFEAGNNLRQVRLFSQNDTANDLV